MSAQSPPPLPTAGQALDPRALRQKIEGLRQAIVKQVLNQQADLPDIEPIATFRKEHSNLQEQLKQLQHRLQELARAKAEYELLDTACQQKRKELAAAEASLNQFARPLGKAAFEALALGQIQKQTVFNERSLVHGRLGELQAEYDRLAPPNDAGIMQKTKAKAQQLFVAGKIKLEEMKIGKLEEQIGRQLLTSNQEDSVCCDHTAEVLGGIAKQRSVVAQRKQEADRASENLTQKRQHLAQSLQMASVDGSKSFDAERRKYEAEISQAESRRAAIEKDIPERLLACEVPDSQRDLAQLLRDLRDAQAHTSEQTFSVRYSFGSEGNYRFDGKGEMRITDKAVVFTAQHATIRLLFPNKPLEIQLNDIGNVVSDGKTVKFSYRQSGKVKRFAFSAVSTDDAAIIVTALPEGGLGELPHVQVQQSEFAAVLNSATPNVFVTPILIGLNVLVFVLMALAGAGLFSTNLEVAVRWGANYAPLTTNGEWWRLLTCAFLHFGVLHILFNMYALAGAGAVVERLYGNVAYLGIYLVSAVVASLSSLIWHTDATISAGASGAVFGVYGALLGYIAIQRGSVPTAVLEGLWKNTIGFVLYSLFYGLAHNGIDNAAHIGGLMAGFAGGLAFANSLDVGIRARQKVRKAITGGAVCLGLVVVALTIVPRFEDANIKLVETGTLSAYPGVPVGRAINAFVSKPRWESGNAKDGNTYVTVRGKATFMEKSVQVVLQFKTDKGAGTFQVNALELNDLPQNELMTTAFLSKAFESHLLYPNVHAVKKRAIPKILDPEEIPSLFDNLVKARIDAAKAAINMFETPLEAYHLDMDAYPSSQEGLNALRSAPANAGSKWSGPYVKTEIPMDPWRNPYRYESPGPHNPVSYDLWSAGPDGVDGTDDDIGNWPQADKADDYDKAIAEYTESIRLDPKDAFPYLVRGLAYGKNGEHDKAIADLTESIRLDPKYAKAYCYRCLFYGAKGDFDKVIADLTEAIRLDPKYAFAYFVRGKAYKMKGENVKAETDFDEAKKLGLNPP